MNFLLNIIWFVCCGFWQWLSWSAAGLLWSLTGIGIPVGIQCFKLAQLAAMPFGKDIDYRPTFTSAVMNIIWILVSGIPLAAGAVVNGMALCSTIIGIPFGFQCFKFAILAFSPFGARVYKAA